jgi:hypothetical protein
MTRHRRSERWAQVGTAAGLTTVVVAALAVNAPAKTHIRLTLTATPHAPGASGVAKLTLRTGPKGRLIVKARHLSGGKSFDVVVNKVKIGTLVTGKSGSGTAKFSTSPSGRAKVLGVDPQGAQIAVRDRETGDDDLEGNMPDDHPGSAIGCCLGNQDDDDDPNGECENLTAAECLSEGGTPTTATSCLPNPCGNQPLPATVACCLTHSATGAFVDDDPNVECEDLTAADCRAQGGRATTATGCVPNPCESQPPPTTVVCCLAHSAIGAFVDDDPEVECEDDVSQAECATEGGMVVQATSCDPNPCQPVSPPNLVICCVSQGDQGEHEGEPQTESPECEHITADECRASGGTVSSAASCVPDPCVASPSGAFLN